MRKLLFYAKDVEMFQMQKICRASHLAFLVAILCVGAGETWLVGCSGGKTCQKNAECPGTQICQDGTCKSSGGPSCKQDQDCPQTLTRCDQKTKQCVQCLQSTDCASGEQCEKNRCIKPGTTPCKAHADCEGLSFPYCADNGTCSWKCRASGDCRGGETCTDHQCRNPNEKKFCVTHSDCQSEPKKFCSLNGDCSWECIENTHCTGGKICKDNACAGTSTGCKSDADCKESGKPVCETATGNCIAKAGCQKDGDCTDANKPKCDIASGQCIANGTGCKSDGDCTSGNSPKCNTANGQCVGCLTNSDCKEPTPNCLNNTCQPKQGGDCSTGCPTGTFCFQGKQCLKQFKECQDETDCDQGDTCVEAFTKFLCAPVCDPTQNKSQDDPSNSGCWNSFGWCYGISDTDPKDGVCFPPQDEIRDFKESCNDDDNPDKPSYHACKAGLICVDTSTTTRQCWVECDPQKNVGGDPTKEDLNPDCETGKGKCSPFEDGTGACIPGTVTPPLGDAPKKGELVINELLADPANDASGDANKDGTRHSYNDEFVEVVNTTTKTLTLDDVALAEQGGTKIWFTFPKGTQLAAGKAAVIFGGGMASDTEVNTGKPHTKFGGALVFTSVKGDATASAGVGLGNNGKTIVLQDAQGNEIDSFTYGGASCLGNLDQSVTRSPDITGQCKLHQDVSTPQTAYSPGTKTDGTPF